MFSISNKNTSLKVVALALVFMTSVLGGVLFSSSSVHAVTKAECETQKGTFSPVATRRTASCEFASKMSPADQLRSYAYFNALSQCIRYPGGAWLGSMSPELLNSPKSWVGGIHDTTVGYFNDSDNGKQTCQDMIIPALTLWGYASDNYQSLLVDMGYEEKLVDETTSGGCANPIAGGSSCPGGTTSTTKKVIKWVGNVNADGTLNVNGTITAFQSVIAGRVYGGPSNNPSLDGNAGLLYYRALFNVENGSVCSASPFKKVTELSSAEAQLYKNNDNLPGEVKNPGTSFESTTIPPKDYLIINIVNPKGGTDGNKWVIEPWVYKIKEDHFFKNIVLNEKPTGGSSDDTCVGLARALEGYAQRIFDDVNNILANGGDPLAKYGAILGNPGEIGAVGDSGEENTGDDTVSCVIEGIGWIVCPVVNFLAGIADGAFGVLADNFLRTDPQVFNTTSPTYTAWSAMRTIANVVFVIVFLIIIFSQLTSLGINNYGVKKMLPRLVIAAILVNVSYFVCQIAVDLSNIIGYSLKDMFGALGASIGGANAQLAQSNISPFAYDKGFTDITGGVLAAAGIGVALYALLSTLIPIILAAVVALIMILFILIARQALIILLIVISPLAFVAFLLPNTEGLFKKWRQALTSMLLLFPIIALVFGASSLASTILSSTFTGGLAGDPQDWFGQIAAAGLLVLPLFVVPTLLKKSLDGIPAIGKIATGLSSRANANLGSKAKESYKNSLFGRGAEIRKAGRDQYQKRRWARRVQGGGLGGLIAGGVGVTKEGAAARDTVINAAKATIAQADSEELKNALQALGRQMAQWRANGQDTDAMLEHTAQHGSTHAERSAAMHQLAGDGRDSSIRRLAANTAIDQVALQEAISAGAGKLGGKAPDLLKGPAGAFGNVKGSELAQFSTGTAQAYMEHLSQLHQNAATAQATAAATGSAEDVAAAARAQQAANSATTAFHGALDDIQRTPALRADFGGDVGLQIIAHAPTDATGNLLFAVPHIDRTTGKI